MAVPSYDVLRDAVDKVGVKTVAYRLGLSPALVYKWCQERQSSADDEGSGARNPLDRVAELVRITGDPNLVTWLCNQADGFFVRNPEAPADVEMDLLRATQAMVRQFSGVLNAVTASIGNDGYISEEETRRIRKEWEPLKAQIERFVQSCERGSFHPPEQRP